MGGKIKQIKAISKEANGGSSTGSSKAKNSLHLGEHDDKWKCRGERKVLKKGKSGGSYKNREKSIVGAL